MAKLTKLFEQRQTCLEGYCSLAMRNTHAISRFTKEPARKFPFSENACKTGAIKRPLCGRFVGWPRLVVFRSLGKFFLLLYIFLYTTNVNTKKRNFQEPTEVDHCPRSFRTLLTLKMKKMRKRSRTPMS